ncbi:MAG: hypothetical protein AAB427_03405 [Chloroflexota bacterium]
MQTERPDSNWLALLGLLLVTIIAAMSLLLFSGPANGTPGAGLIPVSLRSQLKADYGVDSFSAPIAPIEMSLIEAALRDLQPEAVSPIEPAVLLSLFPTSTQTASPTFTAEPTGTGTPTPAPTAALQQITFTPTLPAPPETPSPLILPTLFVSITPPVLPPLPEAPLPSAPEVSLPELPTAAPPLPEAPLPSAPEVGLPELPTAAPPPMEAPPPTEILPTIEVQPPP